MRPPSPWPVRCTTVSPPAIKARLRPCPAWVRAMLPRKLPASRASQQRQSVSKIGSYPSAWQASAAARHSSRTLPVIFVVTLGSVLGVSCRSRAAAAGESASRYFSAMAAACAQVELSGQAGPLAIISSGSPRMSLSTTLYTAAGAQASANRPPLTADSRLRIVLISTISAPQAKSACVTACSSSAGNSGFSNSALPPPESRNSTVSSARRPLTSASARWVAAKLLSSGTGCPASQQVTPGSGPLTWPYFVMTIPPSTRPSTASAAWAICHAALPAATRNTRPCG